METIKINHNITVMYLTAVSFPDGIATAHEKLHARVPRIKGRRYFGISRPEKGKIVYKACAEEMSEGESKKLRLESLVLKKGDYLCVTIQNYPKHIESIDTTFKRLLAHADLDPQGYCIEWYINDRDVTCMVRLQG